MHKLNPFKENYISVSVMLFMFHPLGPYFLLLFTSPLHPFPQNGYDHPLTTLINNKEKKLFYKWNNYTDGRLIKILIILWLATLTWKFILLSCVHVKYDWLGFLKCSKRLHLSFVARWTKLTKQGHPENIVRCLCVYLSASVNKG